MLAQTCPDFEYIVVDGGSTDGTVDIIREYAPGFGDKLHWISEADNGIFDAMNKGVRMAKGEIVGIISSDDYYPPAALEIVSAEADKFPDADIFYGLMKWLDKDRNEIFVERRHHSSLPLNPIPHPASFIKRKIYEQNELYDTSFKLAADYDLLLRLFLKKYNFLPVDKILAVVLKTGASNQNSLLALREVLSIKHKHKLVTGLNYYYKLVIIWARSFLHAGKNTCKKCLPLK